MTAICNVFQVTTPPVYDDIYQDYKYYSIVLNSIIRDIELFQLYNSSFKSLLCNFQSTSKDTSSNSSICRNTQHDAEKPPSDKISHARTLLSSNSKILCTPIAKNFKSIAPCSKKDWDEQLKRMENNLQMMWDDSSTNKSVVGDLLAVCHNGISVDFHIITNILSPHDRLSTWSDNVGQTDRQVIYIDNLLYSMPWSQWISLSNYSSSFKCQGTKNTNDTVRKNIITYLLQLF